MGSDSDQDVYLMDNTVLSDLIDDEGQHLMFTFDYMTDRSFFMEMKELIPGKNLMDPICSLSLGKAPAQNVDLEQMPKRLRLQQQRLKTWMKSFSAQIRSTKTNSTLRDSTK